VAIFAVPGCECGSKPVNGGACNGIAKNQMQCQTTGHCLGGACINQNLKDGSQCNNGIYCETDECKSGVCKGTAIPDKQQLPTNSGSPGTISFEAAFTDVGTGMQTFFKRFAIPFTIFPLFNASSQTVLTCCEDLQKMDVPVSTDSVTVSLKASTAELTPIIAGVPLSFTLPSWFPGNFGPQGITVSFNGTIGGMLGIKDDHCKNTVCALGGPVATIAGQGTFQLGYQNYAYVNANIQSGISGGLTVGCGVISGTLQWDGIKLQGVASLGTAFQFQLTYQLVNPVQVPIPPATY
jgi:hypothetical protein